MSVIHWLLIYSYDWQPLSQVVRWVLKFRVYKTERAVNERRQKSSTHQNHSSGRTREQESDTILPVTQGVPQQGHEVLQCLIENTPFHENHFVF